MSALKIFQDTPVSIDAKSTNDEVYDYIRKRVPNLGFLLFRDVNRNVLVLQIHHQGRRVKKIEQYWILLDPKQRKNWEEKYGHDREELTFAQQKVYQVELGDDWFRFAYMPKLTFGVQMKKIKDQTVIPLVYCKINNKKVFIHHALIETKNGFSAAVNVINPFAQRDVVKKITIFGSYKGPDGVVTSSFPLNF